MLGCAVHGKCTLDRYFSGVVCCDGCDDNPLRPSAHPPARVFPLRPDVPPPSPRPSPAFVFNFGVAVKKAAVVPYPDGRYAGTGIAIPAGGWGHLPGVFVTASILRWVAVNSRLPIEVWYIGDEGERDPLFDHITRGLGVTWRNASEELRRLGVELPERLRGWALKPLVPLLSSFERVVMMDADCYPVYDPERLLADPRIGGAPAAFWPDNPGPEAGRPLTPAQWDLFGMDPPPDGEVVPGFESGQMVIDKRRSWHAVQVAAWLAGRFDEFDATRGRAGGLHGDKEVFSVAWRATGTPYHMARPVRYHEVAFLQHDPDGEVCFVHRCNDKPRVDFRDVRHTAQKFTHAQFRSATLPHEHMFHKYLEDLRHELRPNVPGYRDGTQDDQVWHEVHTTNCYRLPVRCDGWRVLDVGAHVGLFALECLKRGAERVVCVEPFRPNNDLLRANLAPWAESGRASIVDAAVAAPGVATVRVAGAADPRYTAEPHVTPDGGVEVPAVTLDALIDGLGRVDLLKFDAEGAEWTALPPAELLSRVDRVALEWHTSWVPNRPPELAANLEAHGFTVEIVPGGANGLLFAHRGAW